MFKLVAIMMWPLLARQGEHLELAELQNPAEIQNLEKIEKWNHEEEVFNQRPHTHFETHFDRLARLGPTADYKKLIL